ncbi:stage II sporulation protein D [Petroclostridium sp. X23]|uniref:stage II sporulation protein D n=1 Tax=Petroclostridium sp. X23 TaxID=3045146 RepID=UPI0024AE838E|nr:stage II sporulation protein D [Petroclostridium sp. X23]WHH57589.1 stage II sporulation protein D [Petroclostridium sp. X23]
MKQLGYAVIFLMLVIILIPLVLVKGCSKSEPRPIPKKVEEKVGMIKVYIEQEDKVVEMDFNEYLKGVVAAEMPASFNIEALKAQAVVARTYFFHRYLNHKNNNTVIPEHKGADICTNPAHCKAWISKEDAMNKWAILSAQKYWDKISKAVDETVDLIVTYDSEPIDAVFHSTSSGMTENSEEVWTNTIPYLRSVDSDGEELSPKYTSVVQVPLSEFKSKLSNNKPEIVFKNDNKTWIEKIEKTEAGSIKNITIGGCEFKGTEIRSIFALNSAHFTIEFGDDTVIFNVSGNGHGVGMSQYGANYLADQGKTYDQILTHYYKDVEIVKIGNELLN